MTGRLRTWLTALALVTLVASAGASAGPGKSDDHAAEAAREHRRIVEYWTAERVAAAVPRELLVDAATGRVITPAGKPDKPGNGGGGGGGDGSCKGGPKKCGDGGGGGGDGGDGGDGGGGGSDPTPVGGANWPGNASGAARQTVGKVFFTMGGSNYVCSAALVDQNINNGREPVVLTAGHCVFDDRADVFATNWTFVPDFESSPTFTCNSAHYGCWTAETLVTSQGWKNSDFNYDVGFARLRDGGKTGNLQAITNVISSSQGLDFTSHVGEFVHAFGYPAASPYNGNRLVYCAGTTARDDTNTHGVACNMTGGASGGPWLYGFNTTTELGQAASVNSYKYCHIIFGCSNVMYGPVFGSWTQSLYNAALTGSSNQVV